MPNFESGVAKYVKATATVTVNFPVDFRGQADISCFQCPYFSRNNGACQLTKEITAYPQKYVGVNCPLRPVKEGNANGI